MLKKLKNNKIIIIFFIIILALGLITYKDYGIGQDEAIQRGHSLVNLRAYIDLLAKLDLPSNIENTITDLSYYFINLPILQSYEYRFYGVGIQLPLALIEILTNFHISTIYFIRHLFCFIIFFIALIYFYLILNKYIVKSKIYSLIGTIFLLLSPRIYGEVFYNIKDTLFLSLLIINCYYILKYINNNNYKTIIQLSFITAITINSRIVGGLAIFLGLIIKLLKGKKEIKKTLYSIFLVIFITLIIYYIITPASWYNLLTFPFETIDFFFNYSDPINKTKQFCFYFGKWISSTQLPWHYLLVWIYITTPILYIILFFIGFTKNINKLIKSKFKQYNINLLFFNLMLVIIILFVCILKPTLYGGWRHMYFIYPIIIINSTIGFKYLIEKYSNIRKILYSIVIINSCMLIFWMIKSHPYQNEYFHYPLKNIYMKNFEVNYSRVPNTEAMRYITKIDKSKNINVYSPSNNAAHLLLDNKDYKRINITDEIKTADYVIDNTINENKNLKHCSVVDIKYLHHIRLYTIYKCQNN